MDIDELFEGMEADALGMATKLLNDGEPEVFWARFGGTFNSYDKDAIAVFTAVGDLDPPANDTPAATNVALKQTGHMIMSVGSGLGIRYASRVRSVCAAASRLRALADGDAERLRLLAIEAWTV